MIFTDQFISTFIENDDQNEIEKNDCEISESSRTKRSEIQNDHSNSFPSIINNETVDLDNHSLSQNQYDDNGENKNIPSLLKDFECEKEMKKDERVANIFDIIDDLDILEMNIDQNIEAENKSNNSFHSPSSFITPSSPPSLSLPPPTPFFETILRAKVVSIKKSMYRKSQIDLPQLQLEIISNESSDSVEIENSIKIINLRDDWISYYGNIRKNDIVNILDARMDEISNFSELIIDIDHGLLILDPDNLINVTLVSESIGCERRAFLSSKYPQNIFSNSSSPDESSINIDFLFGIIIHEIVEECLMAGKWDISFITDLVERLTRQHFLNLFLANIEEIEDFKQRIWERISIEFPNWCNKFIKAFPSSDNLIIDSIGSPLFNTPMSIDCVHAKEESIWSHRLGIKGKIDLIVGMTCLTQSSTPSSSPTLKKIMVPMEIKTGKYLGIEHRAQSLLYSMLMIDKYENNANNQIDANNSKELKMPFNRHTLLFYTFSCKLYRFHLERRDIKALIQVRNKLAMSIHMDIAPEPIDNKNTCKRCSQLDACLRYRIFMEEKDPHMEEEGNSLLSFLNCSLSIQPMDYLLKEIMKENEKIDFNLPFKSYFNLESRIEFTQKWTRLIAMEEAEILHLKKGILRESGERREEKGLAILNLNVLTCEMEEMEIKDHHSPKFVTKFIKERRMEKEGKIKSRIKLKIERKLELESEEIKRIKVLKEENGEMKLLQPSFSSSQSIIDSNSNFLAPDSDSDFNPFYPCNLKGNFNSGDLIIVSLAGKDDGILVFAMAIGFIIGIDENIITCSLDRQLPSPHFHQSDSKLIEKGITFRIDKDEMLIGFNLLRGNILFGDGPIRFLTLNNNQGNQNQNQNQITLETRRNIEKKFKFNNENHDETDNENNSISEIENSSFSLLDEYQKMAIKSCIESPDYHLINGMPGTGKTWTICHLIKAFLDQGKTILLTSHTHSAIDLILLKLIENGKGEEKEKEKHREEMEGEENEEFKSSLIDKGKICRLGGSGSFDRIHRQIKDLLVIDNKKFNSIQEFKEYWNQCQLVAVTSMGINNSLLGKKHFDVCIVDESTQLTLPSCLGSISLADKFILIGDPMQLPPLVRSKRATELNKSLFKILADKTFDKMSFLRKQYRMNREIMNFANILTYQGLLECGNDQVANNHLTIPIKEIKTNEKWIEQIVNPEKSVFFLDTNGTCSEESFSFPSHPHSHSPPFSNSMGGGGQDRNSLSIDENDNKITIKNNNFNGNNTGNNTGSSSRNIGEVHIIKYLLGYFLRSGILSHQISLITPYRAQVELLKPSLKQMGITIATIDTFQGQDCDIVIFSCVKSNPDQLAGDHFNDHNRLNVALTRARKKLIIIGDGKTILAGKEGILLRAREFLSKNDMIIKLENYN